MQGSENQPSHGLSGDPLVDISPIAEAVAQVIEIFGIGVIVLGAVLATSAFLYGLYRKEDIGETYHQYRSRLGRGILLGLESLVAADIIGTVAVEPTFQNLGVLGLIVLIRTFLSFSLEVEINGHWPWQASKRSEPSTSAKGHAS